MVERGENQRIAHQQRLRPDAFFGGEAPQLTIAIHGIRAKPAVLEWYIKNIIGSEHAGDNFAFNRDLTH